MTSTLSWTYTYRGRPLPAPPPSLPVNSNNADALLVTAWVVGQLQVCPILKVRDLLRECKEVQRLLTPKTLPDDKGTATCDLVGTAHAYGVACHLFMPLSSTETGQCSTCASALSTGPMAECVHGWLHFSGGACTNCYYRGRGALCSLRTGNTSRSRRRRVFPGSGSPPPASAASLQEEQDFQGYLGELPEKGQKSFRDSAFADQCVSGRYGPQSEEQEPDDDMDSEEDELPPLLPDSNSTRGSAASNIETSGGEQSSSVMDGFSADFPFIPKWKLLTMFRELQETGQEEMLANGIPPEKLRELLEEVEGDGKETVFQRDSFFGSLLRASPPQDHAVQGDDVDMDDDQEELPPMFPDPEDIAALDAQEDAKDPGDAIETEQGSMDLGIDWVANIDIHRMAAMPAAPQGAKSSFGLNDPLAAKRNAQTDLRNNISAKKQKQDP